MTGGRTVWWAKDAAWWRREWIVELGEEFGAAGPAIIDWLSSEAKAQNDGGFVKSGRRSVSRGCFVELVTVGHVLSRAVTLGLLEDFKEDNGRFTCRISGWQNDQQRALAANRKAKQRANTGDEPSLSRSVTPVTKSPPTGQDRTVVKDVTSEPEKGKEPDPADVELCHLLAGLIRDRDPRAKCAPESARWLTDMRLLRERDDRGGEDIAAVIRWCQASDFWHANILSPGKLREKFPTLWAQMQRASGARQNGVEDSAAFLARRAVA